VEPEAHQEVDQGDDDPLRRWLAPGECQDIMRPAVVVGYAEDDRWIVVIARKGADTAKTHEVRLETAIDRGPLDMKLAAAILEPVLGAQHDPCTVVHPQQ